MRREPLVDAEERAYRKMTRAWAMYDWANSAFATTIIAAIFPFFYRALVLESGRSPSDATAYWGYTTSLSLLLIAVLGPLLGAISDCTGGKKKYVALFAGMGISGTACMVFLGGDHFLWGTLLFLIGNVGFAGANIFYESLLPHVAREEDLDRVSTMGYAIGYIGGGSLLILNLLWLERPEWFGIPDRGVALRLCFLSVAVWWGLFSIPLFRRVSEPAVVCPERGYAKTVQVSLVRLGRTLRQVTKYRQLVIFLVAFWVYNDAIGTIIKLATAFGDEIGIGQGDLVLALVMTQFIGVPCAFGFGWLAGKIGAKRGIGIGLAVYMCVSMLGFFMRETWQFYLLAGLVGVVQGGTQGLSRSLFAAMVPRTKAAEFFGFFSTGAKFAGVVGPFLFAMVAQWFGSSRPAILSVSIFFVVGGALLLFVDVDEGKRVAREEDLLMKDLERQALGRADDIDQSDASGC